MKLSRFLLIASCFVALTAARAQQFNFDWSGTPGWALPQQSYTVRVTVVDNDQTDYGFSLNLIEDNTNTIAPNQSVSSGQQQPPFRLTISGTVSHNDTATHYYQAVANSYKGTTETSTFAVWLGDQAPSTTISAVTPGPFQPGQEYSVRVQATDPDNNLAAPGVYLVASPQNTIIYSWPTQPAGTGSFDQSTPLGAGNTLHAPSTPGPFQLQSEVNDQVGRIGVSSAITLYVVTPVSFSWTTGGPNKQFTYTGSAPDLASAISSSPGGVAATLSYPGGTAPTTVGTYTVTVTPQDTNQYAGSSTLTYTITPESVTYTWTSGGPNKQFNYTGSAPDIAGSITSNPAGVTPALSYPGGSAPSAAGGYTVTVTPQSGNYSGSTPLNYTIVNTSTPPSVTINASSSSISQGDSVTITWTITNDPNHPTTQITASGDGISTGDGTAYQNLTINSPSSADLNRSITITGLGTGSHPYSVTATNDGGPTTRSTPVQVNPGAATAWITATPTSALSADHATTTVAWGSTNANSVTVKGEGAAPTGISSTASTGSQMTLILPANPYPYVFTITAVGSSNTVSQTAGFQVGPPAKDPPTITWTGLLPDAVALNQSFTIAATGHDRNGNLTSVKIFKDGALFQSATNTGTFDLSTSGACSQATAGTVTFTAQALDSDNQVSATITHTVYIGAIAGDAPLPSNAPVIAGSLDGQVTVDNHGAANYAIPLRVAPGRLGMEPKLSLAYDSSSGNGPLGIGWSLATGFPHAITRGRTIYARDNIVRGVHFDSSDKYYLDGKRLLWTGGSAEGSGGSQYHTEVESFDAITASGSGSTIDYFTVLTKDGLKMVFGKYNSTTDGYQCGAYDANGDHIVTGGELDTLAYSYALKHVEDTLGNSIDFTYATDNDGEYELSQIDYTGNSGLGITAQARVRCVYNLNSVYNPDTGQSSVFRADMPTRYIAEREFPLHKRLDRIVLLNGGGNTMTGAYDLQYEYSPDNGPTRLKQVTGYFKDPVSQSLVKLNPTTFTWSAGSSAHRPISYATHSGDANGWTIAASSTGGDRYSFGDVDGDGKDDLLDFTNTGGVYVSKSDGTNFASRQLWPVTSWSRTDGGVAHTPTIVKVCDINGDGKKDLVFGDARGADQKLYVAISTGSGFTVYPTGFTFSSEFNDPVDSNGYDFLGQEGNAISNRLCTGDFNGDGRDDVLIHRYDGQLTVLVSNGTGFNIQGPLNVGASALQATAAWDFNHFVPVLKGYNIVADFTVQMIPCDLNGDGLTDYAWVESTQRWGDSSSQTQVFGSGESVHGQKFLYAVTTQVDSAGNVSFSPKSLVTSRGWGASTYNPNVPYRYTSFVVETADVNGDGLTDFVTTEPTTENTGSSSYMDMGHQVFLSMGSSSTGAPLFKNIGTVIPSTVQVGSTTVNTWFDKVSANLWTGDSYRTLGTSPSWTDGDPRRNLFMALGLSSPSDNVLLMDVNSDGMADFVWYSVETGQWLVLYSHGESYATTPVPLPIAWTPSQQAQSGSGIMYQSSRTPVDINGDGVPDFVCQDTNDYRSAPGVSYVMVSSNDSSTARPGDTLFTVTNGLGSSTTINYAPITDNSIYTPGASAITYPIRELRNPTYVVSDVEKDTGSSTPAEFQYQYSGNELDLSGRGSLGFHSFVTLDTSTRIVKYQFLAQAFPMTGLAVREQTYRSWLDGTNTDFRTINSHDNTVVYDSLSGFAASSSPLFPFISTAVESRWEDSSTFTFQVSSTAQPSSQPETAFTSIPTDTPYVKITATSKFDGATSVQTATQGTGQITNGNLTELATDYGDGSTETVKTDYVTPAPAGTNLTGLVLDKTTTVTSGYGTQAGPKTSYTYSGNTPLVATATVDASAATGGDSGGTQTWTTAYGHDSRGRVTTTQISGKDLQSVGQGSVGLYTVSNNTAFDDNLDLPATTLDAYNNATTTTYDQIVGEPLTVTGPNAANDTTSYTYDALGRTVSVTDRFGQKTTTTYTLTTSPTVSKPTGLPSQDGAVAFDGTPAYSVYVAPDNKPPVTTYYDRLGRVIRTIKEGFSTTKTYTDTVYNTLGQVSAVSVPYANGATDVYWSTNHYDALGRPDSVTGPHLLSDTGTILTTTTTYNGLATKTDVAGDMDVATQSNSSVVDAHGHTVKVWNADNVPTFTDTKGATATPPSITFKLDGFGRMRETDLKDQTQTITANYDGLGRQSELNDPDKGDWTYVNSALGQVLKQTDARSTVTQTTYDKLGRPLTRTTQESGGPLETANWNYYDSTADPATHRVALGSNGWIGALQQESVSTSGTGIGYATANSANSTTYYYDAKGRPQIDLNAIDGTWFYAYTDYTEPGGGDLNRVNHVQYFWRPSVGSDPKKSQILAGSAAPYTWRSFGYTYSYDSKSYVLKITDTNAASRTWWQADATAGYDELDRPVKVTKGGLVTTRTYRKSDGVLTNIVTAGTATLQNFTYTYDELGNLKSRTDNVHTGAPTETLVYDVLNRLTSDAQGTITYLANGNIQKKPDVTGALPTSAFAYSATRPHAVTSAWGYTMDYDSNGNIDSRTKGSEKWGFAYAGFDKPRWMIKTDGTTTVGSEFLYNANRSRVLHLSIDAATLNTDGTPSAPSHYARKRIYGLGATLEADYKNNAAAGQTPDWQNTVTRIYVPGPDGVIGTEEFTPSTAVQGGLTEAAHIYHYDHLGSIQAITVLGDGSGNAAVTDTDNKTGLYSEDAWGSRRNPLTWSGAPASTTDGGGSTSLTPRGFTGHEMLDDLGLVHMNGRIYDPLLGRMLSADLVVQSPSDGQDYNRYTYVLDNPLRFTDPTGWNYEDAKNGMAGQAAAFQKIFVNAFYGAAMLGLAQGGPAGMQLMPAVEKERQLACDKVDKDTAERANNDPSIGPGHVDPQNSSFKEGEEYFNVPLLAGGAPEMIEGAMARASETRVSELTSTVAGDARSLTRVRPETPVADPDVATKVPAQAVTGNAENTQLALYDPQFAATQLLDNGTLSLDAAKSFVPKDAPNTFKPSATIAGGQKFGFDINGTKIEFKFHMPDANAAAKFPGSNSGTKWTAQIKVGGKLLGTDGKFYKKPSDLTHIPLKELQ